MIDDDDQIGSVLGTLNSSIVSYRMTLKFVYDKQ